MSSSCSHWIWSSGEEAPMIVASNRLEHLTSSLPRHGAAPSLILIIGCRQRHAMDRGSKRLSDRICLDFHDQGEVPLLLATTTLRRQPRAQAQVPCCHPTKENHPAACNSAAETDAIIFSQLMYPFVDVICFYAYRPKDLEGFASRMSIWYHIGRPALRIHHSPRVLVVLAGSYWTKRNEKTVQKRANIFVKESMARVVRDYFPKVSFLRLPQANHFFTVRSALDKYTQAIQETRRKAHALFTTEHFTSLFGHAFRTVGRSSTFSFDCLRAARQDFPVSPSMAWHFKNFVRQIPLAKELREFAAPVIASCILFDQYPPGMHHFKPAEVYDKLYGAACLETGKAAFQQDREDGLLLPSTFSALVLANLESLFEELLQGQCASSIHRGVLERYAEKWRDICSSGTCLSCFASDPQYVVDCGHAFCENCVQVFGLSEKPDPLRIYLHTCVLCQVEVNFGMRIRPPTAGHGILCIDGGGVGGIISSTVLELIEHSLGLPIPIQEHFSMAYGVSAGGLLVLALYEIGWSAATCSLQLQSLAEQAFYSNELIFFFLKWFHLLLFGCLYPAAGIERALQGVFGDKTMATTSYATRTGTRLGILTASIDQPTTYLFTNYNGVGAKRNGYLVSRDSAHVKTWKIARSTSAAPMYFSPKYIPGLGTLQDGGVLRNNPTMIALSEFTHLTKDAKPDFVINLGTGSSPQREFKDERSRGVWRSGWLLRLIWAYMSHLQGERTWNDLTCLVKRNQRGNGHYRLDVTLEERVRLDDTTSMPLLRSVVLRDKVLQETIQELTQRLFAALFYFELTTVPTRSCSRFDIQGQVLCIRKARDPALPQIQQRLSSAVLSIDGKNTQFTLVEDAYGNIGMPLSFTAEGPIMIELREGRSGPSFPLSGAPYTIPELVARSGLAASFGTRIHKRRADHELSRQFVRRRRLY